MSANLSSLLNAAAGEIGLPNRVGKFLRALAQGLVSSGVSSPQYGFAKLVTPQPINGTTNLVLDAQGLTRGLGYNATTGTWVLTAGKTYRLTGRGYADTFSAANAGIKVQWVDDNNVVLNGGGVDCPPAQIIAPSSTGAISAEPATEIIYTAPNTAVGRSVKLRVTALSGTVNLPASSWSAVVQEIPG